jgi:catalase
MATPIKQTPILYGKDAQRFAKLIAKPKPVSQETKDRQKRAYEFVKSISKCDW